ncbi:hypothetical protein Tco_1248412 [Tanacetum coccineum]
MLAIFHDMIEESVEVYMDDFSVFGDSFDKCLNNLDKMLQHCKDAHLALNWEKCHFMGKEEIVLGHKSIEKVMAEKEKKSSMETFVPNDKVDYYSRITSIIVNRKKAYELKGKFLDDLHNNAFSGTNGKYAVEHIEYYLRIIDPIKLPNVDHDKLIIDYWKMGDDEIEVSDDESSNLEEYLSDKEETAKNFKIEIDVFDYETPLYWREDGYCNGGNLPGAYHIGNSLHYQDLEWYEALEDSELKDKALRNKAIMEGLINDDESSNDGWRKWESHEITFHDHDETEYENETHDERQEVCETYELPVCNIRKFEMIKYSFGQDEEYVAVKEDEYDDLARTSNDACRAYQEIFRMMDEAY